MRELASGVDIGGPDTRSTSFVPAAMPGTFNVSTASMFVAAAAGCHASPSMVTAWCRASPAAPMRFENAGLRLGSDTGGSQCVREVGVGFMFAPGHHSAMKHAIDPAPGDGCARSSTCSAR